MPVSGKVIDALRSCCAVVALLAPVVLAASARSEEAPEGGPDYARKGVYLGIGGSYVLPSKWNSDFYKDIGDVAQELRTESAFSSAAETGIESILILDEKTLTTVSETGGDLDDSLLGIDLLVGYRIHERVAFEVEGEWLAGSNKTTYRITDSVIADPPDDPPTDPPYSGDSGVAAIEDVWTVTANTKLFLLTRRYQPFLLFGLGVNHSTLAQNATTSGLKTRGRDTSAGGLGDVDLPSDFSMPTKSEINAAIRVGVGIDAYVTEKIAAELKVDYVYPFSKTGNVRTDYYSLQWGILYRF